MKCDLQEAACHCVLDEGHDGAHRCDCGGSWGFSPEGKFEVHSWPVMAGLYPDGPDD